MKLSSQNTIETLKEEFESLSFIFTKTEIIISNIRKYVSETVLFVKFEKDRAWKKRL